MRVSTNTEMTHRKKIAVLSGKGGTGKTLIAVNLASVAAPSLYIDCDAEEPNGHLFFRPEGLVAQDVSIPVPRVDPLKCDGCRACVDFCAYHALAYAGKLMIFDSLCHGCGGCVMVCPQQALSEVDRPIGRIQEGSSNGVRVRSGFLTPGEASGVPIIKSLLREPENETPKSVFIDCPPGSSCMVTESISGADYCLLVGEPTLFGAHNLRMVHQLTRLLHKPCGAVLNKCLDGSNPSEDYCLEQNIPILARIPFDERLGLMNSNARIAALEETRYRAMFEQLLDSIRKEMADAATGDS